VRCRFHQLCVRHDSSRFTVLAVRTSNLAVAIVQSVP
jgi:hypothetical protein